MEVGVAAPSVSMSTNLPSVPPRSVASWLRHTVYHVTPLAAKEPLRVVTPSGMQPMAVTGVGAVTPTSAWSLRYMERSLVGMTAAPAAGLRFVDVSVAGG